MYLNKYAYDIFVLEAYKSCEVQEITIQLNVTNIKSYKYGITSRLGCRLFINEIHDLVVNI